jgi:hypothetical protein
VSPARRLLEDRIARISDDLDVLFTESRDRARREHAEQLNQAVRRLRIAGDPEELCGTLENAAALFANGTLLLRVNGDEASNDVVQAPLASAPALAAAIDSREPQTTALVESQIGPELIDFLEASADTRLSIFPIDTGNQVRALLCAWGNPQSAALELLAQFAGAIWNETAPDPESEPEFEPEPAPASNLISIAPAPSPKPAATWESLPPDEQQIHLRAQRFARVHVAEMRLYEADAVQRGRSYRDLYDALRERIDAARQSFEEEFFANCPSMVDYLHLELVHTLANDDQNLLGTDYPGPLV